MDGKDMKQGAKPPRRSRRLAATGLVVSGLLAGGILAGSQVANAASSPTSSASTSAASSAPNAGVDPTTMTARAGRNAAHRRHRLQGEGGGPGRGPGRHRHPGRDRLGRLAVRGARPEVRRKHRHREDRQLLQRDEHGVGLRRGRTDVGERIQRLIGSGTLTAPRGPGGTPGPLGTMRRRSPLGCRREAGEPRFMDGVDPGNATGACAGSPRTIRTRPERGTPLGAHSFGSHVRDAVLHRRGAPGPR